MKMTKAYIKAKAAKVGDTVNCPTCNKEFVKKTYNQVFCNNVNNTKFGNCKDKYWNTVDPRKRNNTTRISPANKRYYEDVIISRQDFDDDPSWDAHKSY